MKRTQVYLNEDQDRRLAQRAVAIRRTKSDLIREAVDAYLSHPAEQEARLAQFKEAATQAFGVAPHLHAAHQTLHDADHLRAHTLDEQWRGENR